MVVYLNTLSVTQVVKQVLLSNRFYFQALTMGIANLTALAERIKPDVELSIGTQVNTNTIVVAIKRLVDSMERERDNKSCQGVTGDDEVRMSLTDGVMDINFNRLESGDLSAIFDQVIERKDSSFALYQTANRLRLFMDNTDPYNAIDQAITKQSGCKIEKRLSKISVSFSTDQQENLHNLLLTVSSIVYSSQIAIHSAFFTPSEIVLILEDRNAIKVYDSLRKELTVVNPNLA